MLIIFINVNIDTGSPLIWFLSQMKSLKIFLHIPQDTAKHMLAFVAKPYISFCRFKSSFDQSPHQSDLPVMHKKYVILEENISLF